MTPPSKPQTRPQTRPRREALYHYTATFDAADLLARYARSDLVPTPGAVTNFLGVKVPVSVFPPILERMDGLIEGMPDPGNWHADIAEWAAALWSVEQAGASYRIVELGCGWGCWLTNMGAVARFHGRDVRLIGIEGDAHHLESARAALALNGLAPENTRLIHGIAGPKRGKAIFPNPEAGDAAWGGEAVFYPGRWELARAKADPGRQILDCYPLSDLAEGAAIDLLHIDIQGAELDYVHGNIAAMERHVRRVLIGTHSRAIEGGLHAAFLAAGWRIEMDRPALFNVDGDGRPVIEIDGVQLWHNPRLTPG